MDNGSNGELNYSPKLLDVDQLVNKLGLNKEYISMVDKLCGLESSIVFNNSSLDHAVYIAYRMFAMAREEILILSGTLDEMYLRYAYAPLIEAGKRVKTIKLITVEEKDGSIARIKSMIAKANEQIGKLTVEYLPLINTGNPTDFRHYYVVDRKAWRHEHQHALKVVEKNIKAEICFNDISHGAEVRDSFLEIWDKFLPKKPLAQPI